MISLFLGLSKGECRPFVIEGYQVGLIRPDMVKNLQRFPDVFDVQPDAVELNPAFRDYDERSARIDSVLRECRDNNLFNTLKGWRDEVLHLTIILIFFASGVRPTSARLRGSYLCQYRI